MKDSMSANGMRLSMAMSAGALVRPLAFISLLATCSKSSVDNTALCERAAVGLVPMLPWHKGDHVS